MVRTVLERTSTSVSSISWMTRRISFSGSSARSRMELRLELMMSVRREKMPMAVLIPSGLRIRSVEWLGQVTRPSGRLRVASAKDGADDHAGGEEHPGLGRAGAQIVQEALTGAPGEAFGCPVAAPEVLVVLHGS